MGFARRGYDWWICELSSLVPESVRTWGQRKTDILVFEDRRVVRPDGSPIGSGPAYSASRDVTVLVRKDDVLVRDIATPTMTRADLDRMLALNGERYFPLPGGSVLISSAARSERSDDGTMHTDLAAIPLSRAQTLADALTEENVSAHAVRIAGTDHTPDTRFDFLPAMRNAGLVAKPVRSAQNWWVAVGILAALNLATMTWRDSADVERLQVLADSQLPAVAVAQRMATRMRSAEAIAHRAATRRGRYDPLSALARTTEAVPDGAWVQRYAWDGTTLRLTGYRSRNADVAGALRRMPGFSNVKSAQTDSTAETATGLPFDLVARIGER
jgi:hypothetical protein